MIAYGTFARVDRTRCPHGRGLESRRLDPCPPGLPGCAIPRHRDDRPVDATTRATCTVVAFTSRRLAVDLFVWQRRVVEAVCSSMIGPCPLHRPGRRLESLERGSAELATLAVAVAAISFVGLVLLELWGVLA